MMTATDELRRILDERGVKWVEFIDPTATAWTDGTHAFITDEYENGKLELKMLVTPEQAIEATLGGAGTEEGSTVGSKVRGKLTAEQVRELIAPHLHARPTFDFGHHGAVWMADFQTIADELNATLGSGECEIETTENWLPAERYHRCKHCGAFFAVMNASGDIQPCVCPNCGKAVKR